VKRGISLGVVILAAGASSRMGRSKLLLAWRDTTVIGAILSSWRQVGADQIAVVCRADDLALARELDRLDHPRSNRIFNPEPARGMFSSIQSAAAWDGWRAELTHFAIALGDQPHLSTQNLADLAKAAEKNLNIWQPSHKGHARHPVLFPCARFQELSSTSHRSLKEFLVAHQNSVRLLDASDEALDFDLDTPADYEALRFRFGKSTGS
jgi:molybdenum cofactor cytidylyltransferase